MSSFSKGEIVADEGMKECMDLLGDHFDHDDIFSHEWLSLIQIKHKNRFYHL